MLEVEKPASSSPTFRQVSPDSLAIFELQTYNGALYAGAGDGQNGYSVWKTDEASPVALRPIVTNAAGRGKEMTSVVSMQVFNRRLYVGASGWAVVFPSSELIRVNRDDSVDLVVGNARFDGPTLRFPISGLPDGYGNLFNGHFWRMETHGGALFMGTNDWSWAFRSWPIIGPLLQPEYGFDMYGTCDGQYWWPLTRNAFGNGLYNFGARTLASSPAGGFVGSANHARGTFVWRTLDPSPCAPPNQEASEGDAQPRRLLTDVESCGTVLTWDGPARRYRVLRSEYRSTDVGVRPSLPAGPLADLAIQPILPGSTTLSLPVAGRPRLIGTTSRRTFVDRTARPGVRYAYRIAGARRSSNAAIVPSARPAVTWREARRALARAGVASGPPRAGSAAVARLARLSRTADGDPQAIADARDVVRRLARSARAARAC
jgi:hypothetical protein